MLNLKISLGCEIIFEQCFISVLSFSKKMSFVSLGRFILMCFILFDVMVNRIVSLISLSDLVISVWECKIFLLINFVSCQFIKFTEEL